MTLKFRRILSLIFLIFFLIITPVIIFYAAGYKIGKNGFTIERTGMLIVDSRPRGAKIFLNGQVQRTLLGFLFNKNSFITTPAKIKNLLPGEYELALELDGYFNWRQKLVINPGLYTSAENIYLFKNNSPIQIASAEAQTISFSPDKNQALFMADGQLNLLNLESGEIKKIASPDGLKAREARWSADDQKLVVGDYLYGASNLNSKIDLSKLTAGSFNYKWYDNTLFYQDKISIYRLNNESLPEKITDNIRFNDYLVKDNYLYLINRTKQTANLQAINLATGQITKTASLPGLADYSFINPEQSLLNIYDNTHGTLYLFDPSAAYNLALVETIENVKTANWPDDRNLLYVNDFEIWLDNLPSEQKTLITRVGQTINNALMRPNENYVVYSTPQTLNAVELNKKDKINTTELTKVGSINSFIINSRGDILYFTGKVGDSEGLYKLSIQ